MYFTEQNVLLKQSIRIEYLIKQKPRGAFEQKQEPAHEEVGSYASEALLAWQNTGSEKSLFKGRE